MARAYEKYMKVFGAKGFVHPDVDFITPKGVMISLRWNKNEYRAYKKTADGSFVDMFLGGVVPDNLKKYIVKNF